MTLSHNDLPPDDRTMKKIIKKKKKNVDSVSTPSNETNPKSIDFPFFLNFTKLFFSGRSYKS